MNKIEFTRGDTYRFKFSRKGENNEIILDKVDEMWFTVKRNCYTDKILIQKKLSDESITFTDDGYYHIVVESEDTKKLAYESYVFDIQRRILVNDKSDIKTLLVGDLVLTEEVTFGGDK